MYPVTTVACSVRSRAASPAPQPIAVALLAIVVPGAPAPRPHVMAGIAVSLAGVVLLFSSHLGASGTSLLAGLAVLGSAIFFVLGAGWIDVRLPA